MGIRVHTASSLVYLTTENSPEVHCPCHALGVVGRMMRPRNWKPRQNKDQQEPFRDGPQI